MTSKCFSLRNFTITEQVGAVSPRLVTSYLLRVSERYTRTINDICTITGRAVLALDNQRRWRHIDYMSELKFASSSDPQSKGVIAPASTQAESARKHESTSPLPYSDSGCDVLKSSVSWHQPRVECWCACRDNTSRGEVDGHNVLLRTSAEDAPLSLLNLPAVHAGASTNEWQFLHQLSPSASRAGACSKVSLHKTSREER